MAEAQKKMSKKQLREALFAQADRTCRSGHRERTGGGESASPCGGLLPRGGGHVFPHGRAGAAPCCDPGKLGGRIFQRRGIGESIGNSAVGQPDIRESACIQMHQGFRCAAVFHRAYNAQGGVGEAAKQGTGGRHERVLALGAPPSWRPTSDTAGSCIRKTNVID